MVLTFVRDVKQLKEKAQNWIDQLPVPHALSQKEKEDLYYVGYHYYRKADYERSLLFFNYLLQAEPSKIEYLIALGACLKMQKKYSEALEVFAKALLIKEGTDVNLFVYVADCYFGLKQIKDGLQALDQAYKIAKKQNNSTILGHVVFMRRVWSAAKA